MITLALQSLLVLGLAFTAAVAFHRRPAALQAQAVAARSYAAARWFERADRAWQLDGDHIVDMEYRALQAPNRSVGEAAVRAGLAEGDRVIISTYSHLTDAQELVLTGEP